jgi:hypothetical protein
MPYPGGKRFAFTVFDDTDVATLDTIRPVYELLYELGFLTTKTCWPLGYDGPSSYAGSSSLEDDTYRDYLVLLQSRGFEIAFHGATMETALRADTERALQLFRSVFGRGPASYAAHSRNRDNLYWGRHRFHFALWRKLYELLAGRRDPEYAGHVPGSDVYWLDLAPELRYVRNFTFDGIDLDRVTPYAPYRLASTPQVHAWFPSCDADNVEEFLALLSPDNQEALEKSGGLCIVSTHFGKGFIRNGRVRDDVARALESLSKRSGWFVPLTPLLDHLVERRGMQTLTGQQLFRLEALWFVHMLLRRRRQRGYEATETPFLIAAQEARAARLKRTA